jgi:hypothetical protein
MTVNRADANGAGSGSAVGSAAAVDSTGKTPAAALPSNSTGQGRAASSGGSRSYFSHRRRDVFPGAGGLTADLLSRT